MVLSTNSSINRIIRLLPTKIINISRRIFTSRIITNLSRTHNTTRQGRHRHTPCLHRRIQRQLRLHTIPINISMISSSILNLLRTGPHFAGSGLIGLHRINNQRATIFLTLQLSNTSRSNRHHFSMGRNTNGIRRSHIIKFTLALSRTRRRHRLISSSLT